MSNKETKSTRMESTVTTSSKHLPVGSETLEKVDANILLNDPIPEVQQLDRFHTLRVVGHKSLNQYRISKSIDDIDNSVKAYEQAVELASSDAQLPNLQYDYATALLERYRLVQNLADLNGAISTMQKAVNITPNGSNDLTQRLGTLSSLYVILYESTQAMDHLSQGIELLRMSINTTPNDADRMVPNLHNISVLLRRRYQLSINHDLADISDSISYQEKLIDLMPEGHENMPGWLDNLGASFEYRFKSTGNIDDISKAILAISKAIDLTQDGNLQVIVRLGKRGLLHRRKFHHGGDVIDISKAVQDHQNAFHAAPAYYPDLYEVLGNLGSSYLAMYDSTEDPEDILQAVEALQNALQLIPEGNPDIPGQWSNLGSAFLRRFEYTGDPNDISESILAQLKAVEFAPDGDPNLPLLLNNLGSSYQIKFEITGDLLDISEAILAHQKSIQFTPESNANMPGSLSNLGIAFQCRADRTGDINDISQAIDAHRRAVELCQEGHVRMPVFLTSLGNAIQARFKTTDNPKDIDESITLHQQAITLLGENNVFLAAGIHQNLALVLKDRFFLSSSLDDIDAAVTSAEKVLELTGEDHPAETTTRLNNLAMLLFVRFEHYKLPEDISKAITSEQKAIQLIPIDHAWRCGLLHNLGLYMQNRFECEGNRTDIETAISNFKAAAFLSSGPPSRRLKAAERWATAAFTIDNTGKTSLEAYEIAISLFSQVAGMDKTVGLRHRNLLKFPELSNKAVATAIAVGDYQSALEWLEQARCLVWNQLHSLRTDYDNLSTYDAKLADDLSQVSRKLEASGLRDEHTPVGVDPRIMVEKIALEEEAAENVRLAREWDALIAKVRSKPEFENFLKPMKYQDLVDGVPDNGYIIVVNIHEVRSDAIAFGGGAKDPTHVPLDKFSYDKAISLVRLLRSFLTSQNTRANDEMKQTEGEMRGNRLYMGTVNPMQKILGDLWTGLVNPVLQALDITSSTDHPKRVWWCPTGPLSFLPIHAAGIYKGTENVCISDYVVSSYIPTASSLLRTASSRGRTSKVLIVGQEDAPGFPPLPGASNEIRALKEKFSSSNVDFSCLEGPIATMERAMQEMEAHSCIHFACHAIQDTSHPLNSGFYLSDGRLELWMMIKLQNRNVDLAFLSACQTSKGNDWLTEEVVHLAAGMLAVGYRGVVATMWSIQDRYGVKVAADFYSELFTKRKEMYDTDTTEGLVGGAGAAHALHYAIKRLRRELGDSPSAMLAWVPYVHMGI